MVKNKLGGNKNKKGARKHLTSVQKNTRYSKDPNEIYACCTKIHGSGQIEVIGIDGISRLCFIRNKFRGRGKRDNLIKISTWLLIGKREFETQSKKLEKCDLLEVYNDYDQKNLEQNVPDLNWKVFKNVGVIEDHVEEDESIVFTDEVIETSNSETIIEKIESDEEIDIDDI